MIRRHVGIAVVLSALGLGLGMVGCGDDETETPPTTQPEAGVDATPDQSTDVQKEDAKEAAADVVSEQAEDVQSDVIPDVIGQDVTPEADAPPPPPSGVIQVLTINDFHGQLDPVTITTGAVTGYYGGVGYLSTYFKAERDANPNTVILNGGDEVGASPTLSAYGTDLPDEPAVLSLMYLGLTASNIGNHNFDRGTLHLKKLINIAVDPTKMNGSTYRYVGTNLDDPQGELGTNLVKPYHMVEMGGIKIAIIGISNPETKNIVLSGQMGTVNVAEPIAAANDAAVKARAAGAHVVLASAHLGATDKDPNDTTKYTGPLITLVKNLQGFDFVQGGHTEAEFFQQVGTTWVAQGPARGHAYYKAKITVTDGVVKGIEMSEVPVLGKETTPLTAAPDAGVPEGGALDCSNSVCPTGFGCVALAKPICERVVVNPDPAVDTLMKPWKDGLAAKFDEQIGKVDAKWARDGKIERSREVPIGDFVADAILDTYKPLGVQIAFMNGGGIRDTLPSAYVPKVTGLVRSDCSSATPCDVVLGDIYSVIPFGNLAVLRKLPGSTVKLVLEHSLSSLPVPPGTFHGKFQQVAGLEFTWQVSAPVGSRISDLYLVDNSTNPPTKTLIDDATEYTVIVNDFMNGGGDGFTMLDEKVDGGVPTPGLGVLADAVVTYIKKLNAANKVMTSPCPGLYLNPAEYCRIHEIP